MFTSHTFALILFFPLIWVYQTFSLLLTWPNHMFLKLSFIFSRFPLILFMVFVIILWFFLPILPHVALPCPLSFSLVSRCYAHFAKPPFKWFSIGRLWQGHLAQFKQRLDALPVVAAGPSIEPNIPNDFGRLPLMEACVNNHRECVKAK